MSIPKDELHQLVDALPDRKTMKAKHLLQGLTTQDKENKQSKETLDQLLTDCIGTIHVGGGYSRNTGGI